MSNPAAGHSFSLNYLNEQQRFHRVEAPVRAVPQKQVFIGDVAPVSARRLLNDAAVPKSGGPTRIMPIASIRPAASVAPIAQDIQVNPAVQETVFEQQFEETASIPKKRRLLKILPIATAGLAVLTGLSILGLSLHQNHQGAVQVAAIAAKAASSPAAEAPPSETPVTAQKRGSYKVAADMPRLLTIPSIHVNARIMSLGILGSGALDTPRNTNDTGWYNGSSKPGEGGAALIVGHVSGPTNVGVFYNLKKLANGDTITVERGDGSKVDYRVVKMKEVASQDVNMNEMLLPVTEGKGGLNLITCAGKYSTKDQTFNDRELVFAEKI